MITKSFKFWLFLFITGVFFSACQKENISKVDENQLKDNTERRILDFKTKVESNSKSAEKITIQDAVWLVEALANYKFCMITEEHQNANLNAISVDSISLSAVTLNNQIQLSEAINVYLNLEQSIKTAFEKFDYSVKFYDLVDVEFVDNEFKVYYTFTYNSIQEKSASSITSDWFWGFDLGKCDGTGVGRDASDVIYGQVNNTVGYPYLQYFTDIHNFGWIRADGVDNYGNYLFETDENPSGDYLMYFEEITAPPFPDAMCIPANAINYYITGTRQALNILREMIPSGFKFKGWGLSTFWQGYGYPNTIKKEFGHSIDVWYGIVHNTPPAN